MYKILHKFHTALICSALAIVTFTVFWQVCSFEFLNYDDDKYVSDNKHISTGLKWDNVVWVFTNEHGGNFHPLTGLSHILDCQLFGLKPGLHHLVNLLFHIANALLLFVVLRQMTGAIWQSAFVAALFAVHPLHVEPVAWISSRKDVLSTLFFLLTIGAYSRYVKNPAAGSYILTLALFVFGLMAKPMLVTLPFVLLLLDYWPLNRFEHRCIDNSGRGEKYYSVFTSKLSTWRNLIWEKIPFFVVTGVASVITYLVFKSAGIVQNTQTFPLSVRIVNAAMSYIRYIGKMIWPSNLAVFYPHLKDKLPFWMVLAAVVLLVVITIWIIRLGKGYRYLSVGWFWYLGTLVPVIGFVQVGDQAMADRYSYVPFIGLFIIIAWAANDLLTNWKYRKIVLSVPAAVIILIFSVCTWFQVSYWRDSVTLFEHALKVTNGNYVAHNNLGIVLVEQNRFDEAVYQYKYALKSMPDYAGAYYNLGNVYNRLGQWQDAITTYKQAIKIKPRYAEAYYNLGVAYSNTGSLQEEIEAYEQAIEYNPSLSQAYYNLGIVYNKLGRGQNAIEAYRRAIKNRPDDAAAYYNLGIAYGKIGRPQDEMDAYRNAIRIKPDYYQAYTNLGVLCSQLGRFEEAINNYLQAVKINPDYADVYNNLGVVYGQLGRFHESIEAFRQAVQIKPDFAEAHCGLGISYIMTGDKNAALAEYEILKKLDTTQADKLFSVISSK